MQYAAFLAALSATGAFAAPAMNWSNQPTPVPNKAMQLTFVGESRESREFVATVDPFDATQDQDFALKVIGDTPVKSVKLAFGDDNINIRCQVLDSEKVPVIMTRGPNVDINFSKGDPWNFKFGATVLSELKCGPSFLKTEQATIKDVNVTLIGVGDFVKPAEVLLPFKEMEVPFEKPVTKQQMMHEQAPQVFEKVALKLGVDVNNQKLRCQALDEHMKPVIVKRGENIDFSFGDGGKGPWVFIEGPAKIVKIECDDKFVKMDASGAVGKGKNYGQKYDNKQGQYQNGQYWKGQYQNKQGENMDKKPMIMAM